jgi:hypothetical protein
VTDSTELQRLTRLRRLARQIAASWPVDLDREQALQVHGSVEWQHGGGPMREKLPSSGELP